MSKTAYIFPGQGSQTVGMGRPLFGRDTRALELYSHASDIAGINIAKISLEGPAEELDSDLNAQICVFVCNEAYRIALNEKGRRSDVVTGYSLGFYNALVAAGCLSFDDALRIVKRAGELALQTEGTMGAIIGLGLPEIEAVCREASKAGGVWVSNVNAARQVLVSGSVAGVERAVALSIEAGSLKSYTLDMTAPYHSPMLADAAAQLARYAKDIEFNPPRLPLVSYMTAEYIIDAAAARQAVEVQLMSSVLWRDTVVRLVTDGVDNFIEVGPGSALSRMVRWVDRTVKVVAAEEIV